MLMFIVRWTVENFVVFCVQIIELDPHHHQHPSPYHHLVLHLHWVRLGSNSYENF